MISPELARQIRYIQIRARRAVDTVFGGEYASVFRGQGIEFQEVRDYQPGDEIRSIDWNVTARMGHPYVKRYVEERELTVLFVVDLSASGAFGSIAKSKTEVAAELTALLAFSAIRHNDRVGLIAFTGEVELFIPPKKGVTHVLRLVRELLFFEPAGTGTDIGAALRFVSRVQRRRATLFLVSDFLAADYEPELRLAAARHDLIAASIVDPHELSLPRAGLLDLQDAETGRRVLVDTSSRRVRADYERRGRERQEALTAQLRRLRVDQIRIHTDRSWTRDLVRFFKARERRAAGGR